MSTTDPTVSTTRTRGRSTVAGTETTTAGPSVSYRTRELRETKPFMRTSEFWLAIAGIVAVLIAGYASDDSLDAARTWALVTAIAAAYIVSRGLAKAGSHDDHWDDDGDGRGR